MRTVPHRRTEIVGHPSPRSWQRAPAVRRACAGRARWAQMLVEGCPSALRPIFMRAVSSLLLNVVLVLLVSSRARA